MVIECDQDSSVHTFERPAYADNSVAEDAFLEYWNAKHDILSAPFSERLDKAIERLTTVAIESGVIDQRRRSCFTSFTV